MFNVQRTKLKMRDYMRVHALDVPPMNYATPTWGDAARRAAWRVTGHMRSHGKKLFQTDLKTDVMCILLGMDVPLRILKPSYAWNGAPVRRFGPPKGVTWHHEDANDGNPKDGLSDVQEVHAYHKSLGWRGIAYHLVVCFNGDVIQGRPLDTIGGHALNAGDWIGVAFEGDYEKASAVMPELQLKAGQRVHQMLERKYGRSLRDLRHSAMPGNSTACPGQAFPFNTITGYH